MTDEEIFGQFLTQCGLGGRFDTRDTRLVTPTAAKIYDDQASRAKRYIDEARKHPIPSLPPIHFDFIDSAAVNAAAFSVSGKYFIGVTWGALAALHMLFFRMLAHPGVLVDIGNSAAEDANVPLIPLLGSDVRLPLEAGYTAIWPRDPIRMQYARLLWNTAFGFLVGHEVAHIANGHVDWRGKNQGTPFIAELGWTGSIAEDRLDRQVIEWDADSLAATHAAHSFRRSFEKSRETPPVLELVFQDEADTFFSLFFAISGLFRLFGDTPFTGADLGQVSYPPERLRQFMVFLTIRYYVETRWDPALVESIEKAMINAGVHAELAFQAITGKSHAIQGMLDAGSPEAMEHLRRLESHWQAKMRAELLPFAYAKLSD
jgi:hypothetical protein